MATTTRGPSPQTEPFPPLEPAPRTPTSLPSTSNIPAASSAAEIPNLLRSHSSQKSDLADTDISPKSGLQPSASPVALTGAAAMTETRKMKQQQQQQQLAAADARETSPNLAVQTMQALMGSGGMSKPSDAPAPDKLSEPLQKVAEKIRMSDTSQPDSAQTNPGSLANMVASTGTGSALTATANDARASGDQFVAEPAQMTDAGTYQHGNGNLTTTAGEDGHKAFSYPGPPPQEQNHRDGLTRGMSLPGSGTRSPRSPAMSNKRHKCPYCETDFTRHHNLKSHLLTHSQEKPYECQTCRARFRRLHDLKRHTKLHTGERPHTCDKCGRRFARGDALARHHRGPGGCAGRRSSFGGEDEFGGDGTPGENMEGIEYDDDGSSPEQARRISEPSRKRAHLETSHDPNRDVYRHQPSTYPPTQDRPHAGSMPPPQVVLPNQTVSSPRETGNHLSPAGGSSMGSAYYGSSGQVLQQGTMIESPKPLSPGHPPDHHRLSVGDGPVSNTLHRGRSPSLTTQFQHTHFGRGSGGRTPPYHPPPNNTQHVPLLPPLVSQPPGRPGLQTSSIAGGTGLSKHSYQHMPPTSAQSGGGASNSGGSLSSHAASSGGSIRDVLGHDQTDIWTYVRSLEQRFSRMQDEYELRINRLHEEVIALKSQVSNNPSYNSDLSQPRY